MRRSRRNGQCVRVTSTLPSSTGTSSTSSSVTLPLARICPLVPATKLCPPKLQPVAAHARDRLVAHAVDRRDVAPVRHGVAALDRLPRAVLVDAVFTFLRRMPTDRRRVEQDLRALHGGEARRLRVPLVPTDQHADAAKLRVPRAEARVARREVEFFVEKRVVRDVHLAIHAEHAAIGVDDDGRVVVKPARAFLEERSDDHDAVFLGELSKRHRARAAGDRLGEAEVHVVLALAKILGTKHFLRADDLGALFCRFLGEGEGLDEIGLGVGDAGVLEQAQGDGGGLFRHGRGSPNARRGAT